ncbi:MAG TPA: TIGR03118 family protein, partial [Candidatus Angelobacter sp.]|nr:TIGR03118 family protein [Candidatus Angelobacter sp.]
PLVVSIPSPVHPPGPDGTPTGAVFNVAGLQAFLITGLNKAGTLTSAAALFMFATEDGTIVGWNPGIDPTSKFDGPSGASRQGVIAIDNSGDCLVGIKGAVYKGLAIAQDAGGNTFLYATNFRAGTVEVYDKFFARVTNLPPDAFTDPDLPHGYAPFNVVLSGGVLFVTYARQDKAKHDPVAGHGRGFVDTFDLSGHLLARFASRGQLNAPWGLVRAPASFGQFAGDVLIGNFGNGEINAFDPTTGTFIGKVVNSKGETILIDGLWALLVGNGKAGGDANKVYFTAGPNGETDGILGSLTPVALGTPCGIPCR